MADLVTLTIDDKQVQVPKGTNLIEAARLAGVEVPYYCYHPHLSIAGNCRMCQVHVEGQPKLTIACNTGATEGMVVRTQHSSDAVGEAQRATLEFLLINHPLDCTVCDQAGHCKLQDYYYDYNAKPSRFIEEKQHKVKAEIFGPEVVYDGERCIVCTRCTRFCDEVTKTGELGVLNRGDRSVIAVFPGKELNNPLSGTVVDLCPVGALTHRRWRFNTRIWYTSQQNSVCTGCSTGCNVKTAIRDGEVVHVKGRLNGAVNQEWMCDEGRYGFHRFQPDARVVQPMARSGAADPFVEAAKLASSSPEESAVFLSPYLTTEEMWAAVQFAEKVMGLEARSGRIAVQIKQRGLTEVERVLISPDYAANARSALLLGFTGSSPDWRSSMQAQYEALLSSVRKGNVKRLLFVGDGAVTAIDLDGELQHAISAADVSVALTPRAASSAEHPLFGNLAAYCTVVLPGRSVNEKGGVMINRDDRAQRLKPLLPPPFGALPEHVILQRISQAAKRTFIAPDVVDDRSLYRAMAASVPAFSGISLMQIGDLGITVGDGTNSSSAVERSSEQLGA